MQSTKTKHIELKTELAAIAESASRCTACELHCGRTRPVFSDGNPDSSLMIIGEGPGQNEDETGLPFVGRAGKLLTQILESVALNRETDLYICNVVKCRPPNNRAPEQNERDACFPFLQAQIELMRPKLILLAGATAMKTFLPIKQGITKVRGQWFDEPLEGVDTYGAKLMPILHPSYLLRNHSLEEGSPRWHMNQDIKEVRRAYDAILAES